MNGGFAVKADVGDTLEALIGLKSCNACAGLCTKS